MGELTRKLSGDPGVIQTCECEQGRKVRENVRTQICVMVKRILREHGYPPNKQKKTTKTGLERVEVLSEGWVA